MKTSKNEIKQKPVTDGMTAEQLRKYKEYVHEEQHGNVGNVWDKMPRGGRSYRIPEATMSDDLPYEAFEKQERKRLYEELEFLDGRPNKNEQIENWKAQILMIRKEIKKIQTDTTFDDDVKAKKISVRQRIIENYKRNIKEARAVLKRRAAISKAIHDKYLHQK